MGRMYSAVFEAVTVSAAQDLFELTASANVVVAVHEINIGVHDAVADEELRVRLVRGVSSTSGSGGSTPTARAFEKGSPTSVVTVEANNTTKMSSGTLTTLKSDAFSTATGWLWVPTPEARPLLAPSDKMTVELVAAPAAGRTVTGTIIFEEIG